MLEGRSEVDFPPEVIEGVVSVEEMASPPDDWHGPEFWEASDSAPVPSFDFVVSDLAVDTFSVSRRKLDLCWWICLW